VTGIEKESVATVGLSKLEEFIFHSVDTGIDQNVNDYCIRIPRKYSFTTYIQTANQLYKLQKQFGIIWSVPHQIVKHTSPKTSLMTEATPRPLNQKQHQNLDSLGYAPQTISFCLHVNTPVTTTTTHHNRFTAFFRDHPGEPVPEENFWTLWCKGRLTEADTPTIWLGTTNTSNTPVTKRLLFVTV